MFIGILPCCKEEGASVGFAPLHLTHPSFQFSFAVEQEDGMDEVCSALDPGEDSRELWGHFSQQVLQVLSSQELMGISLLRLLRGEKMPTWIRALWAKCHQR